MSSPTSKAYAFAIKGSSTGTSGPSSDLVNIRISREGHEIPITKMVGITNPIWEKAACFSCLSTALRSQLGSHSVSDLVTAVASHLPIETTAAFEEATGIQQCIQKCSHSPGIS